jgi:hypothetical protein
MNNFMHYLLSGAMAVAMSMRVSACPPDELKSHSDEAQQGPIARVYSDGRAVVQVVALADEVKAEKTKGGKAKARAMAVPGDVTANIATNRSDAPWIGVRLTTIPDPLAAHIGNKGLMIANVAKNSPAEQVGLKQYDVIVSFDGQQVTDLGDLVEAVAKVGTSRGAMIEILRNAQRTSVQVTPAKRPDDEVAWAFPEPKDPMIENLTGHGLLMKPGPGGNWVFQDIDDLPDVHDILKSLDLKQWNQFMPGPNGVDINSLNDAAIWRLWQSNDDDADAKTAFKINVVQDGKGTEIERDADGKITVTHTDANGKESTATYESMDEFEKGDAEAYQLFQNMHMGHGAMSLRIGPGMTPLNNGQFRLEIAKRLHDDLDRSRQQADQLHKTMRRHMISRSGNAGGTDSNISVNIDNDGPITVRVNENGGTQTYKFDSKDEFKEQKPDLYERVKTLFED